jgi:hypothetical protein
MCTVGLGTNNDCDDEDQQQFYLTDQPISVQALVAHATTEGQSSLTLLYFLVSDFAFSTSPKYEGGLINHWLYKENNKLRD